MGLIFLRIKKGEEEIHPFLPLLNRSLVEIHDF